MYFYNQEMCKCFLNILYLLKPIVCMIHMAPNYLYIYIYIFQTYFIEVQLIHNVALISNLVFYLTFLNVPLNIFETKKCYI